MIDTGKKNPIYTMHTKPVETESITMEIRVSPAGQESEL
jgi:hypothetical protein